jgi:hypothetical protein
MESLFRSKAAQNNHHQNRPDPWLPTSKLLPIVVTRGAAPARARPPARKRSSRNSLRHGLAVSVTATAERVKDIERLARKIAGASADILTLEGPCCRIGTRL